MEGVGSLTALQAVDCTNLDHLHPSMTHRDILNPT